MLNQFSRTQLLFGKEAMEELAGSMLPYLESAELAVILSRHLYEAESEQST